MGVLLPDRADGEESELDRVVMWREREALDAGFEPLLARMYAEGECDAGELRKLVKQGCQADLLAKILL